MRSEKTSSSAILLDQEPLLATGQVREATSTATLVVCKETYAGHTQVVPAVVRNRDESGSLRTTPRERLVSNADEWLPIVLLPAIVIMLLTLFPTLARAGGPKYVAGVSYFNSNLKGTPLTWQGGVLDYYTDQGSLSTTVAGPAADIMVDQAFRHWTNIATAAVYANQVNQLSQDVNGSNLAVDSTGAITMPLDIQPNATGKPVAIVYDADGTVTDALLGAGAGSASVCSTNSVFGGIDNFGTDGHFKHALVVINGNCATDAVHVADTEYHLTRVLGQVLGLGWSQVNVNVSTFVPPPSSLDYSGFPVMHALDRPSCYPISNCDASPDVAKMDDRAALSRLYPVTPQNATGGKHPFAQNTARVYGTVRFANVNGQPGQPMQGVNVVARWIDSSGQPSRQYALSSVSGFLFRGNAGNEITGFTDSLGQNLDRWGSDDVTLEGFFDLSGLEFPAGQTAQYQISVEGVDPNWSLGVGPYGGWPVKPSGTFIPVVLTVSMGGEAQYDITMAASAVPVTDAAGADSFVAPAAVPHAGEWTGSLLGYGDSDYVWFRGQTNRTMSVEVEALDESAALTGDKARPVIGMWALGSPQGTIPGAATPSAFNTMNFAMTRLDAILNTSTDFRIGIADERGDGRPDYRYRARVLYGDKATPARTSVHGGYPVAIDGMGFRSSMSAKVGQSNAQVVSVTPNRMVIGTPALPDGLQTVTLSDASSGGSTVLTDVLTYGAGPNDSLLLTMGTNLRTPVGIQAANPVRVRVLDPNGAPVRGASVRFVVTPAAALSACGGASNCTVLSDDGGEASTYITPLSNTTFTITAMLAPASYPNPKTQSATLQASSSSLDIGVASPYRWIAQGASGNLPLTARVLSNGSALSGRTVNFNVLLGSATLSSASSVTDGNGYAAINVQISNLSADVRVNACVAPTNTVCALLTLTRVAPANLKMGIISGSAQMVGVGQAFQPVAVRVTDSSSPANAVQGANVNFAMMITRPDNDAFLILDPEGAGGSHGMPVILGSSQASVLTDAAGVASVLPTAGSLPGMVEIEILASAGPAAIQQFELESIWPVNLVTGNTPFSLATCSLAAVCGNNEQPSPVPGSRSRSTWKAALN
jgi:IPT/TIG domain